MRKHNEKVYFSLLQLNKSIKNLIEGINKSFWINAEIAQVQFKRHIYLELVHKEEEVILANNRANIWESNLIRLKNKFGENLESVLQVGNKVLVEVVVTYHEVYGISLNVVDIEPSFTIGELERQRLASLKKLEEQGLLFLQNQLKPPRVLQKIAVISSPTAAGLSDFLHQLRDNEYGYQFHTKLFAAAVQGAHAAKEIQTVVQEISESSETFDVIVLIRGGGSRLDLEVFNNYELAVAIAESKRPILTGIGHYRDETIADNVAHRYFKTPTAVAEYLIDNNGQFEYELIELGRDINDLVKHKLIAEQNALLQTSKTFQFLITQNIKNEFRELEKYQVNISHSINQNINQRISQLDTLEKVIAGYSIEKWEKLGLYQLQFEEKPLQQNQKLKKGDTLSFKKGPDLLKVEVKEIN